MRQANLQKKLLLAWALLLSAALPTMADSYSTSGTSGGASWNAKFYLDLNGNSHSYGWWTGSSFEEMARDRLCHVEVSNAAECTTANPGFDIKLGVSAQQWKDMEYQWTWSDIYLESDNGNLIKIAHTNTDNGYNPECYKLDCYNKSYAFISHPQTWREGNKVENYRHKMGARVTLTKKAWDEGYTRLFVKGKSRFYKDPKARSAVRMDIWFEYTIHLKKTNFEVAPEPMYELTSPTELSVTLDTENLSRINSAQKLNDSESTRLGLRHCGIESSSVKTDYVIYVDTEANGQWKTAETKKFSVDGYESKVEKITVPAGVPIRVRSNITTTSTLNMQSAYYLHDNWYTEKATINQISDPASHTKELTVYTMKNLKTSFNQVTGKVLLSWDKINNLPSDYEYYVYRTLINDDGTYGGNREEVGYTTSNHFEDTHDRGMVLGKNYRYEVVLIDNSWKNNGFSIPSDPQKLTGCSFVESKVSTMPNIKIHLTQNMDATEEIYFSWNFSNIPEEENDLKFRVHRIDNDGTLTMDYGFHNAHRKDGNAYFIDYKPANKCDIYKYYVQLDLFDNSLHFFSDTLTAHITASTTISEVDVSKGSLDEGVRVTWRAHQVGTDATTYKVKRRFIGTTEWSVVHTTKGTDSEYTFLDTSTETGRYYEYLVEAYGANCEDSNTPLLTSSCMDSGFGQVTGTISGRVTFDTGTAVDNVKVNLLRSDDEKNGQTYSYARHILEGGNKISWHTTADEVREIMGAQKDWSVQMWVRPDFLGSTERLFLLDVYRILTISLQKEYWNNSNYNLRWTNCRQLDDPNYNEKILYENIPANEYVHISVVHKKDTVLAYINGELKGTVHNQDYDYDTRLNTYTGDLSVDIGGEKFTGYFDEVRIWERALSAEEVANNYGRILSGREDGLKVYWPFDEGLDKYAFDFSRTNGVSNGNHPDVANTHCTQVTPTSTQLGLYGLTNEKGEYIIRGIPFTGSGTGYTVVPEYGVHEFSPTTRTGFISAGSMALNNYDFNDISSFKVSGKVYYAGTDVPVDSVQFAVDGVTCMAEDEIIYTDANGEYTISVPIGFHYITASRSGHTLEGDGRYPQQKGETFEFRTDQTINFTDNTLVHFAGRVTGGDKEGKEPLGYGVSKNTIGQATLQLEALDFPQCRLNVMVENNGLESQMVNNKENLPVDTYSDLVNSESWRAGGDDNAMKNIYIKTDPKTGEFSAMLPPLRYRVTNVKFEHNPELDNESAFQNLNAIDLTNVHQEEVPDTCWDDDSHTGYEPLFRCLKTMRLTYRSPAEFEVYQIGSPKGFFGEDSITVSTMDEDDVTLPVATVDNNDNVNYLYAYPIFQQNEEYEFKIRVYEPYINYDDDKEGYRYEAALADSVITVDNEMGEMVMVAKEDASNDSTSYKMGDIVHLEAGQLQLDSLGTAVYKWKASFPNLTAPYTRTMNVFTSIDGSVYGWKEDTFDGIILGCIPTGNNFVTVGPDNVVMVLRDPPGANSSATWQNDTIIVSTRDHLKLTGGEVKEGINWGNGMKESIFTGVGVLSNTAEANASYAWTVGEESTIQAIWGGGNTSTVSTSEKITTNSSVDYVGSQGDVFIGYSKNYLFGGAMIVGLFKQTDGSYALGMEEGMSVGDNFNTSFRYSQYYIETTQLPNLKMLRNQLLTHVNSTADIPQTVTGERPVFYTTLSPDDPRYGSSNCDQSIWGNQASGISNPQDGPSYSMRVPEKWIGVDSIAFYNQAIANWINCLTENEKDKVDAYNSNTFDRNISWDRGTSESHTSTSSGKDWDYGGIDINTKVYANWKYGASAMVGGTKSFTWSKGETGFVGHNTVKTTDSDEEVATFAYILNDASRSAALTVDVFKSPKGWGPIFRTRGGQTRCPYEGEEKTKYYNPGTLLNYATMKIDNPKISIPDNMVLDVPSGRDATLEVVFTNESETGEELLVPELMSVNNPTGLQIYIDGEPITSGLSIPIVYGVENTKTLTVRQSDTSILDYDDIELGLFSTCQFNKMYDSAKFSVHFTPAAPEATFIVNKTVVNSTDVEQAPDKYLTVTAKDFDRSFQGFKSVRVKYRFIGDNSWITAHEFFNSMDMVPGGKLQDGQSLLPENKSSVSHSFALPTIDGHYMVCVETTSMYGAQEVTWQSEEKEVVKDTHGPMLLGQAYPNTGILTPSEDIHVKFNEPIRSNYLTDAKNFKIVGELHESPIDHYVSLQLNGTPLKYEGNVPVTNTDFAASMWLYRESGGTILAHGSDGSQLALSVDDSGYASLTVGSQQFSGNNVVIPANQWVFITTSYVHSSTENYYDAQMSTYDETLTLFDHQVVPEYTNVGPLTIGDGLKGAMHDLSVWDVERTPEQLRDYMHKSIPIYKDGLVGYWRMNEGHGTQVTDCARGRNIYLETESWNLDNENLAAHLDGTSYIKANIATESLSEDDNYMLSLWFKGDAGANAGASLFSLTDRMSVDFGSNSDLLLRVYRGVSSLNSDGQAIQLTNVNYSDGQWHHFALNVRRGTSANVYIDGQPVKTISETEVPAFAATNVFLGARERSVDSEVKADMLFKGDIDEFTVWKATIDGTSIRESRYFQSDSISSALLVYYPMESKHLDSNGVTLTEFSLQSGKRSTNGELHTAESKGVVQALNAPPLKTVATRQNIDFDFTASEDEIYITLKTLPSRMHGNLISFTIQGVPDVYGNLSNPITWTARANYSTLKWEIMMDEYAMVSKDFSEEVTISVPLVNIGSESCNFALSSLPPYITADKTEGTIGEGQQETITFTVTASTPLGTHHPVVYASNNEGILEPLPFSIRVFGNVPEWTIDGSQYDSNMNIIGQVYVKDRIATQDMTRIYAFIGDECRGVASPQFISSRDAYFTNLVVYGNEQDINEPLTFRIYDGERGLVYSDVLTFVGEEETAVKFITNQLLGNYNKPVKWNANELIEQIANLNYNWNWMSIYVQPLDGMSSPDDVLGTNQAYFSIKDKPGNISFLRSEGWEGSLATMAPGNMYKLRMASYYTKAIRGKYIDPKETALTIHKDYNWIGSLSCFSLNLNDAFADLNPEQGDYVIAKDGVAFYNGFQWDGTLHSIVPGVGYIYYSASEETKTFHFPDVEAEAYANAAMFDGAEASSWTPFTPVDHHQFPDNMNVIATLTDGTIPVDTACVAAFIDGECRGVTRAINGIYYIPVAGHPEETGKPVQFRTFYDGELRGIVETSQFVSDNIEGDPGNPKTLTIGNSLGMDEVFYSGISISPGKTSRMVYVRSQKPLGSVKIYSTVGALLRTLEVDGNNAAIDLLTLPDGLYIVKAMDQNGNESVKRVIKTYKP